MKIIFLDFDGVLVTPRTHIGMAGKRLTMRDFDPVAIGMINRLCEETESTIVISSTWRFFDGKQRQIIFGKDCEDPTGNFDLRKHIRSLGLTAPIHDDWQTFRVKLSASRGMEIRDWLEDHPDVTIYIAIDDDTDFADDMRPRLVRCNGDDGFSYQNYCKAAKLLGVVEGKKSVLTHINN